MSFLFCLNPVVLGVKRQENQCTSEDCAFCCGVPLSPPFLRRSFLETFLDNKEKKEMELTICAMSGGHEEIDGRCPLDILVVDNQDTVVGIRNVMHSF